LGQFKMGLVCSICNKNKEETEFYFRKDRGVFRKDCKQCVMDRNLRWSRENKDKKCAQSARYMSNPEHREMANARSKEWYRDNREHKLAVAREWERNNRDRISERRSIRYRKDIKESRRKNAERRLNNVEEYRRKEREYSKRNKDMVASKQAKRRAMKLQRSAKWGNKFLIDLQYKMARKMTDLMGEPYHVDHIIPLKGVLVSGLHVHNNLQVIRADENLQKSNRWEV